MVERSKPRAGILAVLTAWAEFHGELASEADLIETLSQLSTTEALPALIRLLRFGDAGNASRFNILDEHVEELFRGDLGRRIGAKLASTPDRVFFTRWQLVSAIKLICTFGATTNGDGQVRPAELLNLLLMINDFVHRDYGDSGPLDTIEQQESSVKSQALKGNLLLHHEPPISLIGRFADILGSRAGVDNRSRFHSWLDIDQLTRSTLGVGVTDLRSVLFTVYASLPNTIEQRGNEPIRVFHFSEEQEEQNLPFCFDPSSWFTNTLLAKATVTKVLDLVSCTVDEIREDHKSKYGEGVGRLFDVGLLLRKPIIRWSDTCFAGLSRFLVVQRYTSGLYWDIHDALPDGSAAKPNRRIFQTFFGELHEDYGRDGLQRITSQLKKAGKKAVLLHESDYSVGHGKNPDNLLVESFGRRNVRCTFFEFKVGRPRYDAGLVSGDLEAFHEDLAIKIGVGVDQEIGLCRDLQDGSRVVNGLSVRDVTRWSFVIVVTDPFPSMGFMLESIREKLSVFPRQPGVKYHGPFVLSLQEFEQLETLTPDRVSDLLIAWEAGLHKNAPFQSFYYSRTRGIPKLNKYVQGFGEAALDQTALELFPTVGEQPG
jgi:hypothetical protein